ncbi:hypothetical protein ACFPRL_09205 [Pseudoclavibacter helvolus]
MPERLPEALVLNDLHVVVEPDERRCAQPIPLEERELHGSDEREQQERAVEDERGREVRERHPGGGAPAGTPRRAASTRRRARVRHSPRGSRYSLSATKAA